MAAELIDPQITLGLDGQPQIALSYALPPAAQTCMLDRLNREFEGRAIRVEDREYYEQAMSAAAAAELAVLEATGVLVYDPNNDVFLWVNRHVLN